VAGKKLSVAIGAVVLLLVSAARGQGDAPTEVDAIIKRAVELRRQGKDREALAELQRAAGIGNPPKLSAQIGFAEQALGLWVPAEKHLRDALEQSGDAWIKKNRRTLEESLAIVGGHLGTLDVWGEPAGAEVSIDGDRVGTLPLDAPLHVPAATIELTVRANGFATSTRKLELSPGANVREHVVLRAVDVTPKPIAGPAVTPAVVGAPPPAVRATPAGDDEHGSVFTRWWFWTIAAVVVAGGVTAAVLATRKSAGCQATTCSTF
jgi:hypothetical protein